MTDQGWEDAYRRVVREYEVLPRTGVRSDYLLLRCWHACEDLPVAVAAILRPIIERVTCLVHNHTPFTEMDNDTIVCAICARRLGAHSVTPMRLWERIGGLNIWGGEQ